MQSRCRRWSLVEAFGALALASFAAAAGAGAWTYREAPQGSGEEPLAIAELRSSGTVKFAFPSGGAHYATLSLRRGTTGATSAVLSLPKGEFLCRPDACSVLVRFDEAKVEAWRAQTPADRAPNVLVIAEPDRFVARLLAAKKVRIEAQFVRSGKRVLKFDVADLEWDARGPASSVGLTPAK